MVRALVDAGEQRGRDRVAGMDEEGRPFGALALQRPPRAWRSRRGRRAPPCGRCRWSARSGASRFSASAGQSEGGEGGGEKGGFQPGLGWWDHLGLPLFDGVRGRAGLRCASLAGDGDAVMSAEWTICGALCAGLADRNRAFDAPFTRSNCEERTHDACDLQDRRARRRLGLQARRCLLRAVSHARRGGEGGKDGRGRAARCPARPRRSNTRTRRATGTRSWRAATTGRRRRCEA